MTRENVLFGIIGLLLGFIVGFIFTSTVNQRAIANQRPASTSAPAAGMSGGGDEAAVQREAEATARVAREAREDFDAQLKAAQANYKAARYDDALEFLLQANKLRPEDYEVLVLLGNVNYEANHFETAGRWYAAALMKRPDDINVRNDLGLTYFLRQPPEIDRAIEEFRRSLEQDPQHQQSLQNMVVALSRRGETAEAERMLVRLEQVAPSNPLLPRLREEVEKARNGRPGATNNSSASATPSERAAQSEGKRGKER